MIPSVASLSPAAVDIAIGPPVRAAQDAPQDVFERTKTQRTTAARGAALSCTAAPRYSWRTYGFAAGACLSALVGTVGAFPTNSLQTPITANIPMSDSAGTWLCNTTQGRENVQQAVFSVQPEDKNWCVSHQETQRDGSFQWDATISAAGIAWKGEGSFVMNTEDGEERGTLSVRANPLFTGWEWLLDMNLTAGLLGLRFTDDISGRHLTRRTYVMTEKTGPWNIFSHSTCARD